MAEREVTIKISAKNLTEAEFKKARKGLASIGAAAKGATAKTTGLKRAFSSFGKAAPGALRAATKAAAVATGAITGLAVAVVKLGERGAMVADVKDAFDRLSVSAGETGAVMLGALQAGVKSTVTNFELMKVANTALGAGLLKSSGDARTLAEGARLLAKRTGTDTVQAFQTMITAIASGRTAQLKQIGLFVDNKKAVEDYAEAQGRTVSSLTDVDRANALQVATLAALRQELASNAPPLADFGELIAQGGAAVKNLVDSLAVMISKSPPLIAGMHAIREVIGKAFGGDQQGLILSIVNAIEKASFYVIEFGKLGISAARFLYEGFAGIKVMVFGIGIAFSNLSKTILDSVASIFEAAASIPVLGNAWKLQAIGARKVADTVNILNAGLKVQIADAKLAALGNDAFGRGLDTASAALDTINMAMVNAGMSQRELSAAVVEGAQANTNLGETIPGVVALVEEFRIKQQEAALDAQIHGKALLTLGSIANIGAANMAGAFERFGIQTRAEMETTLKQMQKDFDEIEASGLATDKSLEESAKKLADYKQFLSEEEVSQKLSANQALLDGSTQILGELGQKYKAAAAAGAVIATIQAIAKANAAYPWPASIVPMIAAGIAGAIQVSKIRSSPAGFQRGTPGLDFQDFRTSSMATLHGREAVIPQGGGHRLAEEIAGALARAGRPSRDTDALGERFERIGSKLDGLPRAIQRAVRDGVILAS